MRMRAWSRAVVWACLLTTSLAAPAISAPGKGFGLFGGGAFYSSSDSDATEHASSGLSIGVDYQVPLNKLVSLNPFLASSSESMSNCGGCLAGHGILGMQLRVWIDSVFAGLHMGTYSEVRSTGGGGSLTYSGGGGSGFGAVVGWENDGGPLFLALQYDTATIDLGTVKTDVSGTRLHIGYRWK